MHEGPTSIHEEHSEAPTAFPEIASEIERMVEIDQEMRRKSLDDDFVWDDTVDLQHTEAMKRIIAQIGWPTVSKVGEDASHLAWLLVQHADHDPPFQQQCLDLMRQESSAEVRLANIAFLEDRVRVNTKRGQLYGTQFHETRDEDGNILRYEPQPIEDSEHLDERRFAMGLDSHQEYRDRLTRKYFPHLLEKK